MGWKGTARSFGIPTTARGVVSSWERESRRNQRELERRQREIEKMEELERATYEVEVYENYLDVITSVHKECAAAVDWQAISSSSPPEEPKKKNSLESEALIKLENYTPSFFDKLFKKIEKKEKGFQDKVEEAKKLDETNYQEKLDEFKRERDKWEIAKKICEGDVETYPEAIKHENPFNEFQDYGSEIQFQIKDKDFVEASIKVREKDVIPLEVKSLLKSGRLSVKAMPKMKFYELYQDFVCGIVLRVARELFALLPIEKALINATCNMLNTKTGHMEDMPILSILIPRHTLEGFNFDTLDPSDSMENFVHNMKFKKTGGFSSIDALNPSDY